MSEMIKVWDIFVRVFHWTLVVSFFIAYITEDEVMWLHELAGYLVLILVVARVLWGFFGTKYARFSSFICLPSVAVKYLKDTFNGKSKRPLGHNPAGGTMVIILLIMLSLTSWSGIILDETENQAASGSVINLSLVKNAYADSDEHDDGEEESSAHEFLEEVHELLANLTLLLVFIHVAGVIFSSLAHHENLVRSMITGEKRKD